MRHSLTLSLIFSLIVIPDFIDGIRITRIEVPTSLAVGDGAVLKCKWQKEEEEEDHIYAVKWYFGVEEFYRWTPLENPQIKTFPTQHFLVNTDASHHGHVFLRNITRQAAGLYRCEVSGEAPFFKTSFSTQYMLVVELPDGAPSISISPSEPYQLQQVVNITCVSYGGHPAPSLRLYLNQRMWPSNDDFVVDSNTGKQMTVTRIQLHLLPVITTKGQFNVKCVAYYPDLYWSSSQKDFAVILPRTLYPGVQDVISFNAKAATPSLNRILIFLIFLGNLFLR